MPLRREKKRGKQFGKASISAAATNALRRRNKGRDEPVIGVVNQMADTDMLLSRLAGNHIANHYREGEYLHVSDLLGKCMRMVALSDRYNLKITGEPIFDSLGVVFALGNAIQGYVTDKLQRTRPKELYGRWSCVCGETEEYTTYDKANHIECKLCKHTLTKYNELKFYNEEYMIVGSIDIALKIDHILYLSEIKSINKESFVSLTRPLPDHVLQVVFYWWLAVQNKYPVYDKVSILYVNKSYEFKTPFKEFQIDPRDYVPRLSDYLEEAKSLLESRQSKTAQLPAKVCPTPASPQAKKCSACSVCFGVE